MQKKVFFFLLWGISVCLLLMVLGGVLFFGKSFPLWYVVPIVMLVFPLTLSLIADKEEYFHSGQKVEYFGWKVILLLFLVRALSFFVENPSLDLLFLVWLFVGLVFGFSGKLSFWAALCFLFSTLFALLLDQQVYAEQFSVFLYYLLCIGVFCELASKTVVAYLDKGFSLLDALAIKGAKMLPVSWHHIWKEYGKEMVLILYIAVVGLLFFLGILLPQSMQALLALVVFFLLVLRVAGKDGRDFLLVVLRYFMVGATLLFFCLWGWSFFSPGFVLPYWELFLFVWLLGVLSDWFWGERKLAITADFFAVDVSRVMLFSSFVIFALVCIVYFTSWKVGLLFLVVSVIFGLLLKVKEYDFPAFLKSLFD